MSVEDIKIVDIEKELSNLWEAQKNSNRIRACLFNLVVYSSEPRRHEYLKTIIHRMVSKFPCRIIFIQKDGNEKANKIHVSVSNEVINQDSNCIACDHILIDISPQHLHRAPYIVIPHLVPDLPVYLLWGQDPTTESVILPYLLPLANRVIFDSDCADNLPLFCKNMQALMKSRPNIDFIDLNWVRIKGWRNILRQVFDSKSRIQHLQMNSVIKISYNNKEANFAKHQEIQALYLAAWLISQMKWSWQTQKHDTNEIQLACNDGANAFTMILTPQARQNLNSGAITSVEVTSSDHLVYLISPLDKLPKVVVHISRLESCEMPFTLPLPSLKEGYLSMTDLIFTKTSPHYQSMLQLFGQRNNSCLIEESHETIH